MRGGRPLRCCIDTPPGQPCLAAEVLALLVLIDSAPSFTEGDGPKRALTEWLATHLPPRPPRLLPAPGDAGVWPSSASQPAAEAEVISACQSASLFGNGDMIDETAFDATQALSEDLDKKVGSTTEGALLGNMEQQCVCEALSEDLPAFLLPVRERPETNQEIAEMQRMKEAAPEHVR